MMMYLVSLLNHNYTFREAVKLTASKWKVPEYKVEQEFYR